MVSVHMRSEIWAVGVRGGGRGKGRGGEGVAEAVDRLHDVFLLLCLFAFSLALLFACCFVLHGLAALPTAWAGWWCHLRRLRSLGRWQWLSLLHLSFCPLLLLAPCGVVCCNHVPH